MRIVFLGTPSFAVSSLKALVENNFEVVGVITAPDRKAGRGLQLQASEVKQYALKQNLPVLQPTNLKSPDFLDELKSLKADLQVIVAFRMLPKQVWNMPPLGTFNLHASLLPQYRGAAPINWAIMNDEKETGVTTFFLQHEIDTGNILFQDKVVIEQDDTAGTLHDKLMLRGAELVIKTTKAIQSKTYKETPQDNIRPDELKSAPKIFKDTCKINWGENAQKVYNQIRGLSPYPGAWTTLFNSQDNKSILLKVFKSEIVEKKHDLIIGTIKTDNKDYFQIAVKNGFIELKSLQQAGKKKMEIKEYLRGFNFTDDWSVK